MWQRSRVIRKRLDIKKNRPRNMLRKIAPIGIHRRRNPNRRKRRIKDDSIGIIKPVSQPGGRDKRVHEPMLVHPDESVKSGYRRSLLPVTVTVKFHRKSPSVAP